MRYLAIFLATSAIALTAVSLQGRQQDLSERESSLKRIEAKEKKLRAIGRRIKAFRLFMLEIYEKLADERLTLKEASERVRDYAAIWNSQYLINLEYSEDGNTTLQLVGRNIIRHFESKKARNDKTRALVARLYGELKDLN